MAGSDTSISLTEDVSAGALNLSAPTDSDGDSLTISITAIPTSGSLKKADGTVLANGDALTTSELEGLTFTPDANTNGTTYGSFSYSVSDGNGGTDTRAITFSVDAVNDAPNAGIIVTELAPTENTTALTTFSATDADGDTLIYSISGGADQDLFQIDSATGVLTFISAPDYENPLDATLITFTTSKSVPRIQAEQAPPLVTSSRSIMSQNRKPCPVRLWMVWLAEPPLNYWMPMAMCWPQQPPTLTGNTPWRRRKALEPE